MSVQRKIVHSILTVGILLGHLNGTIVQAASSNSTRNTESKREVKIEKSKKNEKKSNDNKDVSKKMKIIRKRIKQLVLLIHK